MNGSATKSEGASVISDALITGCRGTSGWGCKSKGPVPAYMLTDQIGFSEMLKRIHETTGTIRITDRRRPVSAFPLFIIVCAASVCEMFR